MKNCYTHVPPWDAWHLSYKILCHNLFFSTPASLTGNLNYPRESWLYLTYDPTLSVVNVISWEPETFSSNFSHIISSRQWKDSWRNEVFLLMIQWEITPDRILLQNPLPTAVNVLTSQREKANQNRTAKGSAQYPKPAQNFVPQFVPFRVVFDSHLIKGVNEPNQHLKIKQIRVLVFLRSLHWV